MPHVTPTYSLAMALGRDAGNRSMRRSGRKQWNRKDWNAACTVTDKLLKITHKQPTTMKKYSKKAQGENALKWIGLRGRQGLLGGLKGTGQMRTVKNGKNYDCCLGRGCHTLHIPFDHKAGSSKEFQQAVGLLEDNGRVRFAAAPLLNTARNISSTLWSLNDYGFSRDRDFKRIRPIIIDRAEDLFEPWVAAVIRKRFPRVKDAKGAKQSPRSGTGTK